MDLKIFLLAYYYYYLSSRDSCTFAAFCDFSSCYIVRLHDIHSCTPKEIYRGHMYKRTGNIQSDLRPTFEGTSGLRLVIRSFSSTRTDAPTIACILVLGLMQKNIWRLKLKLIRLAGLTNCSVAGPAKSQTTTTST